jgi:hypothetical protein
MSPFFKLRYFLTNILAQPGNAVLILGVGYFLVPSGAWRWARNPDSWLIPLLSGSLFLGALVAAIPLPQYFYAPVPLAVVGLAITVAKTTPMLRKDYWVLFIVTIVPFMSTAGDYRYLVRLFRPGDWAAKTFLVTGPDTKIKVCLIRPPQTPPLLILLLRFHKFDGSGLVVIRFR